MGVVKVRRKDHDKEGKHTLMENIKLRVTTEVLDEYVNERLKREKEEESSHDHIKTLEEEVKILQVQAEKAKAEADKCQAEQVRSHWQVCGGNQGTRVGLKTARK